MRFLVGPQTLTLVFFTDYFDFMNRAYASSLLKIITAVLFFVVAFPLSQPVAAADIASLYAKFTHSSGKQRQMLASELQKILVEEEYVDKEFFDEKKYRGQAEAAIHTGVSAYFYYQDQYDMSEKAGLAAIDLLRNEENDLKSDAYSTLGCAAHRKGEFVRALDYVQHGLAIDTKRHDDDRMGSDLNTIAGIYLAMNDAESAERYILRAITLQRKVDGGNPSPRLGIKLGMASEVYLKLKKYEKSFSFASEAYSVAKSNADTTSMAIRQCQMASPLYELKRYDDAERNLRQAMPVLADRKKNNSLAICYAQLADIMAVKKRYAEAEKYYRLGLDVCLPIGNRYLESRCEKGLATVLRTHNPVEALKHLERFSALADSIRDEEAARQSSIFNAKYKNEELQRRNAEVEATNRMFRLTLVAIIVVLCLLVALAVALYVAFKIKSRAHDMARRLEQTRTSFFTNITHEFRTPLTVILGASERLKNGDLAPDENPATLYAMIQRQGHGLLQLINQLLDIAKVKSEIGNPDWRHGNVVPCIRMVADAYSDAAREKGVEFQLSVEHDNVEMDFVPDYLHKALGNLIGNAIKFTPEHGVVQVAVKADERQLLISVSDTGCGIPKEDLGSVFDAFLQASNAPQSMGTGVGLALVKQVVTAMKGEVSVTSTVGEGSTFTVQIPLRQNLDAPAPALCASEASALAPAEAIADERSGVVTDDVKHAESAPTVLVVEDNRDISYYIGSQLQSKYNVYYATNGEEGFAMASEIMPSLIITDLMMPVCDGYELCRRLHASEALNHIPVVILTAKTSDADRVKALEVGVDNLMTKPFSSKELELRVGHLIAQREALRRKFSAALAEGKEKEVRISEPERAFLEKLERVVSDKMPHAELDVESVASALCMSQKQLRNKLSSITGETPSGYIQRLRIGKACTLLATTDCQIGEIAMQCGFDDSAYFSRIFKQVCGVTPTAYRKQHC